MPVIISFLPTECSVLRYISVWQNQPGNIVFALLPINSNGRWHMRRTTEAWSFTYALFCMNFQNFEDINIASPGCGNSCLHKELHGLL